MKEILEGMLRVFEEKDWIQGHLYRSVAFDSNMPSDPMTVTGACLEGACHLVMQNTMDCSLVPLNLRYHLLRVATDLFPERMTDIGSSVVGKLALFDFNDHPNTTLEDIRLVIKTAIDRL